MGRRVQGAARIIVVLGITITLLMLAGLATIGTRPPSGGPEERSEHLLHVIQAACRQYETERRVLPPSPDSDGGTRALAAALTRPSGAGGGGVEFLVVSARELDGSTSPQFVDGWGRPLRYGLDGRRIDLRSAGHDGVFGTPDDIVLTK